MNLYRDGRWKAAAHLLGNKADTGAAFGHLTPDQHRPILQQLYRATGEWIPPDSGLVDPQEISFPSELVRTTIQSLDRDKAKGVSGWTYTAIRDIFAGSEDEEVCPYEAIGKVRGKVG